MNTFRAERLIYGKLARSEREHSVVAHSVAWPREGGVPKSVGVPMWANFEGACSFDWHLCGTRELQALSWCEVAPRITRREFLQSHCIFAKTDEFAPVMPFLPALVEQLRQIPVFTAADPKLSPFIFAYPSGTEGGSLVTGSNESWLHMHWNSLASILTALLEAKSVYVHNAPTLEGKTKIIAMLMLILPLHLRQQLTFSTGEAGHAPDWRRLTFSCRNRTDTRVIWHENWANDHSHPVVHPWVAEVGRVLRKDGLAALLAEMGRPELRHLSFDLVQKNCAEE